MNRHYIVAMVNTQRTYENICKLDVGKRYTFDQAMIRAEELNKTCQPELKVLDYQRFAPYNLLTCKDDY